MRRHFAKLLLAAVPLTSWAQPLNFKDFVLGNDLQAQADAAGLFCMPARREVVTCGISSRAALSTAASTIAGVPVERLYFMGTAGRLGDITVRFPAARFEQVLEAYRDRFPTMKCEESSVQNRLGARFDQMECRHRAPDGSLFQLEKRASTLDLSQMSMTTPEMANALGRSSDKSKEEAKKDI